MILDGKETSKIVRERIKEVVSKIDEKIKLLVILVGDDPASQIYVSSKEKASKSVGIKPVTWYLDKNITQKELINKIHEANNDPSIHGILVQLPLPKHLEEQIIINEIDPLKDVDGLTYINQGKLFNNQKTIVPATPLGVMKIFEEYKMDITSKNALVIGRSNLVSKPLAMLLLQKNATVTIAHSKTKNLKEIAKTMDIVISCVGKPKFITADMIKEDAIV
ncbi:MAG: bifunctional 5,10-methylenetetrahydrofolate dehydrogenase/5,10-methenyltetrahydrofolate cyclohydrolase, partial [Bacilli bacterium]